MGSKSKHEWKKKRECNFCHSLIVTGGHELAPAIFVCNTCNELINSFCDEVKEGVEYGFFTSDGRSGVLSPEKLG